MLFAPVYSDADGGGRAELEGPAVAAPDMLVGLLIPGLGPSAMQWCQQQKEHRSQPGRSPRQADPIDFCHRDPYIDDPKGIRANSLMLRALALECHDSFYFCALS